MSNLSLSIDKMLKDSDFEEELEKFRKTLRQMRVKATLVPKLMNPKVFVSHSNISVYYTFEKENLKVVGSMFTFNWDKSFRDAIEELERYVVEN
jgi:hypothetical protein